MRITPISPIQHSSGNGQIARLSRLNVCLFLALVATLAAAHAGTSDSAWENDYNVTDLGTLPGKANSWVWIGTVNNSGVVSAYANDNPSNPNAFAGDVSFLWQNGRRFLLPGLPGASDTTVFALNDRDQAVGYSGLDGFQQVHAVLWDAGRVQDLGTLPDAVLSV